MTASLNSAVPARDEGTQLMHILRKTINYNSGASAALLPVGTVPANSIIVGGEVWVSTAFNGTSNGLTVGTLVGTTSAVTAYSTTIDVSTSGVKALSAVAIGTVSSHQPVTSDTTVIGVYTFTGTPTAGSLDVALWYLTANGR